jgi:hypothetical protein
LRPGAREEGIGASIDLVGRNSEISRGGAENTEFVKFEFRNLLSGLGVLARDIPN